MAPTAYIKVDGKEWTLLTSNDLTNKEIAVVERYVGESRGSDPVPVHLWDGTSVAVLTGLLWAVMHRENPDLKIDDVEWYARDFGTRTVGKARPPSKTKPKAT